MTQLCILLFIRDTLKLEGTSRLQVRGWKKTQVERAGTATPTPDETDYQSALFREIRGVLHTRGSPHQGRGSYKHTAPNIRALAMTPKATVPKGKLEMWGAPIATAKPQTTQLKDGPRGLPWSKWLRKAAKTLSSQCRGLGSIPGQGARSHVPQLRPSTAKYTRKNSLFKMDQGLLNIFLK